MDQVQHPAFFPALVAIWVSPLGGCLRSVEPPPPPVAKTARARSDRANNETPYLFKTRAGASTPAFRGVLTVPENRSNPDSRTIDLHYVRFAATTRAPGPPIVYLAGGPGGSGVATARGRRFPLFMAMRAFGDVIAFDQRGTGWSSTAPDCPYDAPPSDRKMSTANAATDLKVALEKCARFWRDRGFDIAGYTTAESVQDVDALRAHLGAESVTLWGISYGTHLALAAVRALGPLIDRLVLASAEGLHQTVKLPSKTDAYFARLQAAIDQQPAAKAIFPDIAALMQRVHAALDQNPVELPLSDDDDGQRVLLTKPVMRTLASASIADPEGAAQLLLLYRAIDHRQYAPIATVLKKYRPYFWPTTMTIMPVAMDIASGIGRDRLAEVERQAQHALLGDILNFPMPHLAGTFDLDLGDDFRVRPRADTPTLLLSGTLDGRTYPASQKDAVADLSNVVTVTVTNAGHNLFMVSPKVTAVIQRFMRNELEADITIAVDAPLFAPASAPD